MSLASCRSMYKRFTRDITRVCIYYAVCVKTERSQYGGRAVSFVSKELARKTYRNELVVFQAAV